MEIRVRNLQPLGGSALPVGGFSIEPGWTSPIIEVEEGSPLEEIITTWAEDGIALVLPVDPEEEAGGATGATHKKRKIRVLNLAEAQAEAEKRKDAIMRKTSLDASKIPTVNTPPRNRREGGTSLKSGILKLDQVPKKRGGDTSLSQEKLNEEMEKLGSNPPPDFKEMMPPPPADESEPDYEDEVTGPSMPDAIEEENAVEPEPVMVEDEQIAEEEALAEEEADESAERAAKLAEYADKIDNLKKSDIVLLCEKLGIEDIKPAMLKADLAAAAASHLIANGIDIDEVIE